MMTEGPVELANVPVLATWQRCRQISDEEWSGYLDGIEHRVRGTMPASGEILIDGPLGDRRGVVGKIVLAKE